MLGSRKQWTSSIGLWSFKFISHCLLLARIFCCLTMTVVCYFMKESVEDLKVVFGGVKELVTWELFRMKGPVWDLVAMWWIASSSRREEVEDSSGVGNGVVIGSTGVSSVLGGGSDDDVRVSSWGAVGSDIVLVLGLDMVVSSGGEGKTLGDEGEEVDGKIETGNWLVEGTDVLIGRVKGTSPVALILEGKSEGTWSFAGKECSSKTTCRDRYTLLEIGSRYL